MVPCKSLDEVEIIATLLCDAHSRHGDVFNTRSLRLTLGKVERRYRSEGLGFLTKTLPRLGKHLDQALTGTIKMNATSVGFDTLPDSKLPRFLGELFRLIFQHDGSVLPNPDASCVETIRLICYPFGKYEKPYREDQEQQVIEAFKKAEMDLSELSPKIASMRLSWLDYNRRQRWNVGPSGSKIPLLDPSLHRIPCVINGARKLLAKLFESLDPTDIIPRHGPGAVATKQRLSEKFRWTNVSHRITDFYPLDEYFHVSLGHVCDRMDSFNAVESADLSAKVILVPKDSRGPRLISCEPVDFQWVQQGLRSSIYRLVERHPISRWNVFFTDQNPNRRGALLGSSTERYSTLDLKEASDRVHLDLVRLLFPERLLGYLEACRSSSTVLPSGEVLQLQKYAPMGSALCFPIMALTIWALLTAHSPNADTSDGILVYGDDVIVPTAYAESAMAILEEFGLKVNRSKSCTQGPFKESCGMDAFKGVDVTPVRIRTVWDESPRPDVYTSWISYANSFYDRRCYATHEYIVSRLEAVYGPIPSEDMFDTCPSLQAKGVDKEEISQETLSRPCPCLRGVSADRRMFKRRWNAGLQKLQYKVRVVHSPSVHQTIDGWSMLLRYFTEAQNQSPCHPEEQSGGTLGVLEPSAPFSVSRYTKRGASILAHRWR